MPPKSTLARAQALGLATPQPGDFINRGDDAITENARYTADALDAAAAAQATADDAAGVAAQLVSNSAVDAGHGFMGKLDAGVGDAVLAVLDDTSPTGTGWVRLTVDALAARRTARRVVLHPWDTATGKYGAPIVVQEGAPPPSGVKVRDTFTRSGELIGSTPDTGPSAWTGPSVSVGDWSLNGTAAVRTADTSSSNAVISTATPGDQVVTASVTLASTPAPANRLFRLFAKYIDSNNYVYLQITVDTTGLVTWNIRARIANVDTTIVSGYSNPFPANTAATTMTVSLTVAGLNVSGTVNGNTRTGVIPEATAQALVSAASAGFYDSGPVGTSVHEFSVNVTAYADPVQTLTVYHAGALARTLDYHAQRLPALLPVAPDLVLIAGSHHYGTTTPADYVAAIESLVAAVRALHPSTGLAVSSQNPQKAPAPDRLLHAQRLTALRTTAIRRGWGYVPALETFRARPDGGESLIWSDGRTPLDAGWALWEDAATAYFNALSFA